MENSAPKSDRLNLRVTSEMRQLLQTAADLESKNLTAFVLEAARVRAEQALADQSQFSVSSDRFSAFMEALERPPRELANLRRLMQEPSLLERSDADDEDPGAPPADARDPAG